jgi:hypothetical protein
LQITVLFRIFLIAGAQATLRKCLRVIDFLELNIGWQLDGGDILG